MRNRRWLWPALFLLAGALFLTVNRGAYRGYFQDDELDNLSWAPSLPLSDFLGALASPKLMPNNFRPVGHFFFWAAGRAFGFDFPAYVLVIHAIHLFNVWLLWLLIRRLGGSRFAAGAGALLFAFHMAVFDLYWKPMYVFDLLCATFCLLAFLAWVRGRWVLALLAFWLAYKSKELAVMLPLVLAGYEYWLGKRRWKPLAPFFAVSLSFGAQGLLADAGRQGEYAFRYGPGDLWRTADFYAGRILLFPKAGFLLPLLPALVRDRRVWVGTAALFLFFLPLGLLGGRLFGAYCYVPLIGLAVAASGIADRSPRALVALFLLIWLPLNVAVQRPARRQALAEAAEHRRYVAAVREFAAAHPAVRRFVYDGRPAALRPWGIKGALAWCYGTTGLEVYGADEPAAGALFRAAEPFALLSWDPGSRSLAALARAPGQREAAFISMGRLTPVRQLESGWFGLEDGYRWTGTSAAARLYRPAPAGRFQITVNIPPEILREDGEAGVRVYLAGVLLGSQRFTAPGVHTAAWDLPPGGAGPVAIRLEARPYHPANDARTLGIAVVSFGFVE